MRNLKLTLFIICMVTVTIQTIRHAYVRSFYNEHSVLDKFNEDEASRYIKSSMALDSLIVKYELTHNRIKAIENGRKTEQIDSLRQINRELYDAELSYEQGIRDWEQKERDIQEVIVFWIIGLGLLVTGIILYRKKLNWLGLSVIISGLVEMIWWSSPNLSPSGATLEFIKFLNVKLVLSVITVALLIIVWLLDKSENHSSE